MTFAQFSQYKFIRFLLSGGVAAVVYALTARSLIAVGWPIGLAGGSAYMFSTPIGYLLHRQFTFRSTASVVKELPRFGVVSLIGLTFASWLPAYLSMPDGPALSLPMAIGLTCVITPMITFTLKSIWVFRKS